jgi:hypothetical protein
MKVKEIIKLFIPPIFLKLFYLLNNKPSYPSTITPYYSTVKTHKKTADTIIVIGNGPSLKEQLETSLDFFSSNICICVNNFVLTEYYTKVKPRIYILIDSAYFITSNDPEKEQEHLSTFNNLYSKTTWNIDFIVNSKYKNNDRILLLIKNQNINVLFINQDDHNNYLSKEEQYKLFNENKISVPAQTVLNTAIYLGIFWRYKNIILIGADTSWHEDIRVDQKTNQVYFEDKHFYDTKRRLIYSDTERTIPIKLHEELQNISNALRSYWLLREYAEYNSVSVFNASGKSWIDAFERKTLEELIV